MRKIREAPLLLRRSAGPALSLIDPPRSIRRIPCLNQTNPLLLSQGNSHVSASKKAAMTLIADVVRFKDSKLKHLNNVAVKPMRSITLASKIS